MLKKFVSSLLVILVLTGCSSGGGSSSSSKANAADLAASLVKDLKLDDKVVSTEDRIIQGLMFFPEDAVEVQAVAQGRIISCAFHHSSSTTTIISVLPSSCRPPSSVSRLRE